ncbi:hypothetical protein J6590_085732 [Homalodisca vitripennis]|nr:hypothetical protein J6590_085732 [Homalodisca vitripennis]
MRLLAGAVVKKRSSDGLNTSPKKQKTESETENILNGDQKFDSNSQQQNESSKRPRAEANGHGSCSIDKIAGGRMFIVSRRASDVY